MMTSTYSLPCINVNIKRKQKAKEEVSRKNAVDEDNGASEKYATTMCNENSGDKREKIANKQSHNIFTT